MTEEHPARAASHRSMAAVRAKDKTAWLALFASDAIIEDPVGASPLDPEGKGHRGRAAIDAFWEANIAPNQIDFEIRDSYACGNECANVGTITIVMPGGMRVLTHGVFVYAVDAAGKLASLRAFWEFEKTFASITGA